jgi:lipopolysaccharide export system protein LptC
MPDGLAGPLSSSAHVERRRRRDWATPGSGHDRTVAIARVALPALVGALLVVMATSPLTSGRDISFVLSKDRVAVAKERLRVTAALYRGQDQKGQPFSIAAKSAVQRTSTDPVVKLDALSARILLPEGPANLVAPRGRYNMSNERVALDGPVDFRSADGYTLQTHDVLLDMETRRLAGNSPLTGTMPLGTFRADRMRADLETHDVVLQGNAHLHITQRRGTSRR